MAKPKGSSVSIRKISFGKKKKGVAKKAFNKHDSRSSYHKRNASR